MSEEITSPVSFIRSVKRSEIKDLRNKHKELLLSSKRVRLQEVSEYVYGISTSEFNELLLKLNQKSISVELLRKIKNSCVNIENIEAVFRNDGAFNALIRILTCNDAEKQLEAAACLTNLSCGPHKCSYKVAKAAGAYLVSFINGSSNFLQDQSIWALANIANDCIACFNIIKSQGVLLALYKSLMSPLSDVQSIAFALSACTKYDDPEVVSLIQSDLQKHLLFLLEKQNQNNCVFLDLAFTISNCCFFSNKYSLGIFDAESVEKITNILLKVVHDPEMDILIATPLIRCIGFLSFDDKICEFLASHLDFCKIIQVVVSAEKSVHLVKEVVWILCNVADSTDIFINITDLMPLINVFNSILTLEKSVTLQVLYFLIILISRNEQMSIQLIEHELLVKIKCLLESDEKDIVGATEVFIELYNKLYNFS